MVFAFRTIIDKFRRTTRVPSSATRMDNLDELLCSSDQNASVMEIEDYIFKLCAFGDKIELLTEPQKRLLYVWSLVGDVMNGGFNQYYANSYGRFAHQAVDALQEISALKAAHIVRQANYLFHDKQVPADRGTREDLVSRIDEELHLWESLDTQFFEYPDDLNALTIEYIKKHRSEF